MPKQISKLAVTELNPSQGKTADFGHEFRDWLSRSLAILSKPPSAQTLLGFCLA